MELRVLKYFIAVASERNITRAAQRLHISQPTLSKQLKDLEVELGVVLFERGNREIKLTEEGVYFFEKAKDIISLVDKTTASLKQNEILVGDVYIGGGEVESIDTIARTFKKVRDTFPGIKIHLYSGNADDVTLKLDQGQLDFGVVVSPAQKIKYDSMKLPGKEIWGLLIRRDHPLAKKEFINPNDLEGVPLMVSNQTLVDQQLSEWLGDNLSNYEIVGTYNLLFNASVMIKEGVACALCLDNIINTANTDLTFVPLCPQLEVGLSIVWRKGQTLSKAARYFLEMLKEE